MGHMLDCRYLELNTESNVLLSGSSNGTPETSNINNRGQVFSYY